MITAQPRPPMLPPVHMDDDPHLAVLKAVLGPLPTVYRIAWLRAHCPRTASLLGIGRNWSGLSVVEE